MRWKEAQDWCLQELQLTRKDRETLQNFKTPEQLQEDLHERERTHSENLINQLIKQIYPSLATMQNLSFLFLTAMQPRSVETALMWGILHLAIATALKSSQILVRLIGMLHEIQDVLARFAKFAPGLDNRTELRHAVLAMFVSLIQFWAEAVTYLKRGSLGKSGITAPNNVTCLTFDSTHCRGELVARIEPKV